MFQLIGTEGVNESLGISTDLNLNKEISEMFLKDWNVIVQVEQSLQEHFYLSTREEKKTQESGCTAEQSDNQSAGCTSKQCLLSMRLSLIPRLPHSGNVNMEIIKVGRAFSCERHQRWNCGRNCV